MAAAFLFDIDGTLIDSVDLHAHAWQETLTQFGFEVPYSDVRWQIGKGGDQLLPVFVPADRLPKLKPVMEKYRRELFKREYLPRVQPFPGVRELFLRIRRDGHHIALASSANADEVDEYKRLLNVDGLIDVQTSNDDVDCSKPCPDVFEIASQRLGVEPVRALVIGDTPYDAIAARGAGLRAVGVLCGGFPENELRKEGCVEIYRDPADLLDRYPEMHALVTRVPRTHASRYEP
jgi:HAD superfamily hydrolase (TIGR01509 family)